MDQQALLIALLDSGLAHCRAVIADHGGILASLFFTGLVGGFTHCAGMCGPFVLSQVEARLRAVPAQGMREWHRLSGAALVPYHLGRGSTYMLLGALAAGLAGSLEGLAGLRWLSAGLLVLAAVLFVGYAVPRLKLALPGGKIAERWWSERVSSRAAPLFAAPVGLRGYALGLMLGFIPCGLLYAAMAASAATGDPVAGAMGMALFTAGTAPSLLAVGLAGHFAASRWRETVALAAPALLVVNAGVLTYMAWKLVA